MKTDSGSKKSQKKQQRERERMTGLVSFFFLTRIKPPFAFCIANVSLSTSLFFLSF
jgi:hypothetical protein